MLIEIGNESPIEAYKEEGERAWRYRPVSGRRVTTISVPAGMDTMTAFSSVVAALKKHMAAGSVPAWIECEDTQMKTMLRTHFGLSAQKIKRPAGWDEEA